MSDPTTLVWISGATEGLGLGLATTCPHPNARIINLSRRQHPDLESVRLDLTDPATWPGVIEHFRTELAAFRGERAIFIQNAYWPGQPGFIGELDPEYVRADAIGNGTAPLVLADAFIRAVRPDYESGLVLMSSAAARVPFEGRAVYAAAKAGIEQFVRVVHRERRHRGRGPWVVAVRPGFVDTPSLRAQAEADPDSYPVATSMRAGVASGEADQPDDAARRIWAALPPAPDQTLLLFGEVPKGSRAQTS
ncbi:Short-chain dehydrogenase [Frankia canadensis]|uniref:Short-chain dehydrogenase n=1 Tax=Frankia canadensis TaxID=1836972 RepID=A0A2I2KIV2_9ACTN|nr:SDR family NAD(P)-dependent oxidoreductase [Frankia canadensis]SNQ45598.1 Short-chain dehydrogenase [Frankia canadensis]SOU52888.1 Short-chain dehydrogenase [Frankia canadensis]